MFKNWFSKYNEELIREVQAFIEDCRFDAYHKNFPSGGKRVIRSDDKTFLFFEDTFEDINDMKSRIPQTLYNRLEKACNYYLTCLDDHKEEIARKSTPEAEDNNKNLRKLIEELKTAQAEDDFSKVDVMPKPKTVTDVNSIMITTEYSIVDVATGKEHPVDKFRWSLCCDEGIVDELEELCENINEDRIRKRKVNIAGLEFTRG